jgi:hypothetical protein
MPLGQDECIRIDGIWSAWVPPHLGKEQSRHDIGAGKARGRMSEIRGRQMQDVGYLMTEIRKGEKFG